MPGYGKIINPGKQSPGFINNIKTALKLLQFKNYSNLEVRDVKSRFSIKPKLW